MGSHSSRVALVTGGSRGIGAGIASRLGHDGWRVVIADLHGSSVPETDCRHVNADVSDEIQVNDLVQGIAAQEGRLHALVCNAGIMVRKPVAELTLAEWSRVIATNLTSTFLLARACERMLRAAEAPL